MNDGVFQLVKFKRVNLAVLERRADDDIVDQFEIEFDVLQTLVEIVTREHAL